MEQLSTQLLGQFFSLPTLIFVAGIGAIVLLIRRIVEAIVPKIKETTWWSELFLPLVPVFLGIVIADFATAYPIPEVFAKAASARAFYGLVCGFFSSKLYRIIWVAVKGYAVAHGVNPDDLKSIRPPGESLKAPPLPRMPKP